MINNIMTEEDAISQENHFGGLSDSEKPASLITGFVARFEANACIRFFIT